MGTKMAPAYANIFMGTLESKILSESNPSSTHWKRYIDDIFLVWTDTKENLEQFIKSINDLHPRINFTAEISTDEITFLDPPGTGRGIIKGEILRHLRTNSNETTFQTHKEKHVENMKKRGYRQEVIDRSIKGIHFSNRQEMLLWVLKAMVGLFGKSLESSGDFSMRCQCLTSNLLRRCVGKCGSSFLRREPGDEATCPPVFNGLKHSVNAIFCWDVGVQ